MQEHAYICMFHIQICISSFVDVKVTDWQRTCYAALAPKLDLHEFAEAGGVVVAHGLGVAKGLEQRVGLQHLWTNKKVSF